MKLQHVDYYHFLLLSQFALARAFFWSRGDHASLLFPRAPAPSLNATGKVKFSGYNVTTTYPAEQDFVEEWSLDIQVTDDVPTDEVNRTRTETNIYFNGPEYLVDDRPDASWMICQAAFLTQLKNDTGKPIDPTCEGVLSNACLISLDGDATDDNDCTRTLSVSNDCDELRGDATWLARIDLRRDIRNHTLLSHIQGPIPAPHVIGNHTEYDEQIRRIYVFVTSWALNPNSSLEFSTGRVEDHIITSCLAVDSFEPDSRTFKGSASRPSGVTAVSVIMSLVVIVITLIL